MGSIMVRGLLYLVLQELLRCATCNTRLQYMYSYSTIKMYHGTIVLEPTSTQCSVQIYRYQTGTCTWHSNVNCQLIEGHVLYAYRTYVPGTVGIIVRLRQDMAMRGRLEKRMDNSQL
jgi:hypothetical protein